MKFKKKYFFLFYSTPGMRKTMSASKGLNRVHFFISKTVIKPETCTPVSTLIWLYTETFNALAP